MCRKVIQIKEVYYVTIFDGIQVYRRLSLGFYVTLIGTMFLVLKERFLNPRI